MRILTGSGEAARPAANVRRARRWPRRLTLALIPLAAAAFAGAPAAWPQQLRIGAENPVVEGETLELATDYRPERVRDLLMAIHGFTRAALDSVSSDVPAILMAFIDDPGEAMLVRRQAAKALWLYPTDPVLRYIEERAPEAPAPLRSVLVRSLGGFAASAPARVSAMLKPMLEDPEVSVRYSALHLAGLLAADPALTTALQSRLTREPDPSLRRAIRRRLAER